MFSASRWANAFLTALSNPNSGSANSSSSNLGTNPEEAFTCLKRIAMPLKPLLGVFSGRGASKELEKLLRESAGEAEADPAVEHAIPLICLMAEKRCLKYIDTVLLKIESILNKKNGILGMSIEAASPMESDFTEELRQRIKETTGAADVKIKTGVRHELLGGYLLRMDGFYIDASLKGQVDKMMKELSHQTAGGI